jgi:2'-5' RNA ligase
MSAANQQSEPGAPAAAPPQVVRPRVFVGVKIEAAIADELSRLANGLERFRVRRIAAADIHLTLVPPWNAESVPEALEKLRLAVASFGGFALMFEHVGYGPDPRRPRLLWAECAASDVLTRLQAALLRAFGRADERPFRPHATLARLRENARAVARRCPIDVRLALTQRVTSVELFQSPPAGERGYRVLASIPLVGEGGQRAEPHFPDRPDRV